MAQTSTSLEDVSKQDGLRTNEDSPCAESALAIGIESLKNVHIVWHDNSPSW